MGIFDFIFGKKKPIEQTSQDEYVNHQNNIKQAPDQYREISQNSDICVGMEFHATCQLRTPLAVLKRHGEIFIGDGEPPTYGEPRDGVWIPKLESIYDIPSEEKNAASDAGSVNEKEYINYAIGLLSIFESDNTINNKMSEALAYSGNDERLNRIEQGLLRCYRENNIADVMARFISDTERLEFYFDKPNKLILVNGVNAKIESALENSGIHTIKELSNLTENDLLKINGIGKVSAKKIINALN